MLILPMITTTSRHGIHQSLQNLPTVFGTGKNKQKSAELPVKTFSPTFITDEQLATHLPVLEQEPSAANPNYDSSVKAVLALMEAKAKPYLSKVYKYIHDKGLHDQVVDTAWGDAYEHLQRALKAARKNKTLITPSYLKGYLVECYKRRKDYYRRICVGLPNLQTGQQDVFKWFRAAVEKLQHQHEKARFTLDEIAEAMMPAYISNLNQRRQAEAAKHRGTYKPIQLSELKLPQREEYKIILLKRLDVVRKLYASAAQTITTTDDVDSELKLWDVISKDEEKPLSAMGQAPLGKSALWQKVTTHLRSRDILWEMSPENIICLLYNPANQPVNHKYDELASQLSIMSGKEISSAQASKKYESAVHRAQSFLDLEGKVLDERLAKKTPNYKLIGALMRLKSPFEQAQILATLNVRQAHISRSYYGCLDYPPIEHAGKVGKPLGITQQGISDQLHRTYADMQTLVTAVKPSEKILNPFTVMYLLPEAARTPFLLKLPDETREKMTAFLKNPFDKAFRRAHEPPVSGFSDRELRNALKQAYSEAEVENPEMVSELCLALAA